MYTSYIATTLSSMWIGYFSLTWLDSIPHIKALLQVITALRWKVVWSNEASVELHVVLSTNV